MALRVLLLLVGCGWPIRPASTPPMPPTGRPVALVAAGSALTDARALERVRRELGRATGRPVVVLAKPVTAHDPAARELAGRLAKAHPSIAAYDWRERRCSADRVVLTAVVYRVDALYRVALDRS